MLRVFHAVFRAWGFVGFVLCGFWVYGFVFGTWVLALWFRRLGFWSKGVYYLGSSGLRVGSRGFRV